MRALCVRQPPSPSSAPGGLSSSSVNVLCLVQRELLGGWRFPAPAQPSSRGRTAQSVLRERVSDGEWVRRGVGGPVSLRNSADLSRFRMVFGGLLPWTLTDGHVSAKMNSLKNNLKVMLEASALWKPWFILKWLCSLSWAKFHLQSKLQSFETVSMRVLLWIQRKMAVTYDISEYVSVILMKYMYTHLIFKD